MNSHTRKKHLVPGMAWAEEAPRDLLSAILARADMVEAKQGFGLYNADDPEGGLFHVLSGRLDVLLPEEGLAHPLGHCLGPGWWAGDISAISGQPRRIALFAGRDSNVLRLTRSELARLCDEFPQMWQILAKMAAENMDIAIGASASLRIEDPTWRVAACLLRLTRTGPGWNNALPISQSELASIANISRRRVIDALSELDRRGATSRSRLLIRIDPVRLQEFEN